MITVPHLYPMRVCRILRRAPTCPDEAHQVRVPRYILQDGQLALQVLVQTRSLHHLLLDRHLLALVHAKIHRAERAFANGLNHSDFIQVDDAVVRVEHAEISWHSRQPSRGEQTVVHGRKQIQQ